MIFEKINYITEGKCDSVRFIKCKHLVRKSYNFCVIYQSVQALVPSNQGEIYHGTFLLWTDLRMLGLGCAKTQTFKAY